MKAPTVSIRRAAEKATMELPFAIPEREWFTLKSAGTVAGMCESYMEKLWEKGVLLGHEHNAGAGLRDTKRVLRISLLAYLCTSARYDIEMLVDQIVRSLRGLSTPLLERMHAAIGRELERRGSISRPAVAPGSAPSKAIHSRQDSRPAAAGPSDL